MIYYAILYMKSGEIHLKPFSNEREASRCLEAECQRLGDKIEYARIIRKDPSKPSFKTHWVS